MWIALVVTVLVVVVSYILYTLRHTSGSELSGNSLDDFITEKGNYQKYQCPHIYVFQI